MRSINRRKFIQLTGIVGSMLLTGCGSGGIVSGQAQIAGGYRFFRLKSLNDKIDDGKNDFRINHFGGSVHISSNDIITFDAYDENGNHGLFQLSIDFSDEKPTIQREHTSLISAEILSDGRVVSDFSSHDVDEYGNVVAAIKSKNSTKIEHYGAGLYLNSNQQGFEPIIVCSNKIEELNSEFNGIIGDVAINDANGILAIMSHTALNSDGVSGESLIHLPNSSLSSSSALLTTNNPVNATDYKLAGLGIVDAKGDNIFAVSCHIVATNSIKRANGSLEDIGQHCILSGYTWAPNDHQLFAAPPQTNLNSTHKGNFSYGPRVTSVGKVCTKIGGLDDDIEMLVYGDDVIRRSDEKIAPNEQIMSFTPGSIGADDIFYYTQYTAREDDVITTSLIAYDKGEHRLLLETDDEIDASGVGVNYIIFSTTTNHVNIDGKIVFLCEFTDSSQSIVVGIPV